MNFQFDQLIAGGIVTAVIYAIGTFVLKYYQQSKTIENNQYINVINSLTSRNAKLEKKVDDYDIAFEKIEKEKEELKIELAKKENELVLHLAMQHDYPFPFWVKNPNGYMIRINKAYTDVFGKTQEEYEGKSDVEIYGEERGAVFRANDLAARNDPKGYCIFDSENEHYNTLKYSLKIGGIVIADLGMAFPKIL